ncbi:protein germ cell-less [Episyrphus balteatus]|uniref:protein germ cell-less n=1 Tax=Episyrphus balteatus TaxID=286459 RepID=UPI002485E84A|nr:protein germ cell-less [Episyrphus balteatus]XP_055840273.1 protein germ cell-less [Episyrphus balteatus]
MGQMVGFFKEPLDKCSWIGASIFGGRRKRKLVSGLEDEQNELNCIELQIPKKKRLLTTTQYIYQALFKEQTNFDISVMAQGNIWHLHKVYLCQSPYFFSMFNGSWKESCQDFVHIKNLDSKITLEALDAVFGSLYSDEIEIGPKAVISILATATLFQLDKIIEKCVEVMIDTINADTSIRYYEASCHYGTMNVKKSSFEWLETNLLCIHSKNTKILKEINIDLMTALILSPDLYVMQTEFSLYTLLRTWMYMILFPNYDPENCSAEEAITQQNFFANRQDENSFLETPEGNCFLKTFRALRTQYLTNHHMDFKTILADKIIPKEWLNVHVMNHWNAILNVDQLPEEGPNQLDKDLFLKNCMRCGRILLEPGYQKWRWTGFNFGLDIILIVDSRVLSIRRHHRNEHERLLSLQTKCQFMIRVCVTSINSQRQRTFTQKSEIFSLSLEKNEEATLMLLDTKLVHPLLISVNLLVVTPTNKLLKDNLLSIDKSNQIPISEIGGGNVMLDAATISSPAYLASFSASSSS